MTSPEQAAMSSDKKRGKIRSQTVKAGQNGEQVSGRSGDVSGRIIKGGPDDFDQIPYEEHQFGDKRAFTAVDKKKQAGVFTIEQSEHGMRKGTGKFGEIEMHGQIVSPRIEANKADVVDDVLPDSDDEHAKLKN